MLMVTETAPTKWRATALGGLVGGYPFGYMLCSAAALVVVPLWGWRSLYFLGIIPALLVLWIRIRIKESPCYERVTAQMLKEGLKKQLDILSPARQYPREMLVASLVYFFLSGHREATRLPNHGLLSHDLDGLRHLRLLVLRLAVRFVRTTMGDSVFRSPGRRSPGLDGLARQPHEPVLGGSGNQLPHHRQLRHRPWLYRRAIPNPDPRHRCGRVLQIGLAAASLAPMIMGWIATAHSVAAGLPPLAVSFLLLAPLFIWFAPDMTRKELTDFVGQKVG